MAASTNQDAIRTFIAITGASEFVAVRKLEEFGGNLNGAVNSYFSERDSAYPNFAAAPRTNTMDMNQTSPSESRGRASFFSAVRTFRPSLLLDPNYRREFYNRISSAAFTSRPRSVSSQRPDMDVGFSPQFEQSHNLGRGYANENMSGHLSPFVQVNPGINEQRDYNSSLSNASNAYGNDAEDQMIQAAIEASKQDYMMNMQNSASDGASVADTPQNHHHQEEYDIARAISLSLKTVDEDKALCELLLDDEDQALRVRESSSRASSSSNKTEKGDRIGTFKQDSLPLEPPSDDENSITIVVRVLDGTRIKRRFLKSDKLQRLFDFINISGAMRPGSYRIVVSYPRHAYSISDSTQTLSEIGLTGKQEALFLEKI